MWSCDLGGDSEPDHTLGGQDIYRAAVYQNVTPLSMIDHAVALNRLLVEAEGLDLNEVMSDDNKTNYTQMLFGRHATLTSTPEGVVTISFEYNDESAYRGDLIIDTHNQLLSDDGTTWEFEVSTADYMILVSNWLAADTWSEFSLTRSGGTLSAFVAGFACYDEAYPQARSNWNMDYAFSFTQEQSLDDFYSKGTMATLEGSNAYGTTFRGVTQMDYFVMEKLVHSYECGMQIEGEVEVDSPFFPAEDAKLYPVSNVRVAWQQSGSCNSSMTYYYNGYTKSFIF